MANTHSLDLELSSSQYAKIADGSQTGLDLSTDFSFEAWIKLEQLPSVAGSIFYIIAKDDGTTNRSYGLFISNSDDKLKCTFHNGANATNYEMDEAFVSGDVGTWIHVAAVADISGPTVTFYKNGSASAGTANTTNATSITNTAEDFDIGCRDSSGTPGLFFDGKIDEVRVFSDIRTSGEILGAYNRELTAAEIADSKTVGYWKFNNSYLDETGNNNDLTASGSPVFSTDVPFSVTNKNYAYFM